MTSINASFTESGLKAEVDLLKFGIVPNISQQIATTIQKFIDIGSKKSALAINAISIRYSTTPLKVTGTGKTLPNVKPPSPAKNLTFLMACGTKFFDALYYLSLPDNLRPEVVDPVELLDINQNFTCYETFDDPMTLAKYLFFIYFYYLTRASPPQVPLTGLPAPVPKFLRDVLGIRDDLSQIIDYVCSFPLEQMDAGWVRHIKFDGLGQETLMRFGLGVAGYRMAAPFKLLDLPADKEVQFRAAYNVAKSFATQAPCWDFHPLTRSANVLNMYGNLNKNLANLMLECFPAQALTELETLRTIFEFPVRDPAHLNYRAWTTEYQTTSPIFTK